MIRKFSLHCGGHLSDWAWVKLELQNVRGTWVLMLTSRSLFVLICIDVSLQLERLVQVLASESIIQLWPARTMWRYWSSSSPRLSATNYPLNHLHVLTSFVSGIIKMSTVLSVYVCHGTLSLLITTHPVMRTSPMRTAPAVHSAIKMMGKLVTANCHWWTVIPFCLRMPRHSNPASDAENVNVSAPKFVPMANAYIEPSWTRESISEAGGAGSLSQTCKTRASKIVVPIFVPQIWRHNSDLSYKSVELGQLNTHCIVVCSQQASHKLRQQL